MTELTEIALEWERLQAARERRAVLRARVEALEAQMRATPEGRLLEEALREFRDAQTEEDEIERRIRRLAVELYLAYGDKKPHPGVAVKVRRVPRYNPEEAAAWCRQCLPEMLVLDEKRFGKYVLSIDGLLPLPPGVEVVEEPFAVLSIGNGLGV